MYEIRGAFFEQYDQLAVDVVGCYTRYPLAFVDRLHGSVRYNYISGPSNVGSRFMFLSAYQLRRFTQAAECSLEEGMTHILTGQLVVYFTDVGFHKEIRECPMDFCEIRSNMVLSLRKREFCPSCSKRIGDTKFLDALVQLLKWTPT